VTGRGGLRAWVVSLAATAVSAYALDATATAAGVALVASGLLGDLGHRWALAVLAASYAVWAWGLRANLRANQELLARPAPAPTCCRRRRTT